MYLQPFPRIYNASKPKMKYNPNESGSDGRRVVASLEESVFRQKSVMTNASPAQNVLVHGPCSESDLPKNMRRIPVEMQRGDIMSKVVMSGPVVSLFLAW